MPRRVKGALRNLEFHFKASSWCSKLFFVFTITRPRRISDNAFHFLLPAPGNGNVGDQAMAESFINYVGHNCVLIVEDQNYFRQKNSISPEPKFIEIPHIINGSFLQNVIALFSILKISNKMKSFSVTGADIMDGAYSVKESMNRLFLLRLINTLGIQSRITGFSWSPEASPFPTKLLQIISNETKLCVRDPKSVERLKAHEIMTMTEVADLVFSDQSVDDSPLIDLWISSSSKPIVTVNISGLATPQFDEYIHQYNRIVNFLHSKGFRILVLPHVFRVGDGDLEVSDALFRTSCTAEDLLITEPLSPAQERALFRSVSFVITGRMHIAILALNVGKPVIALESMGKVRGLFDLFDLGKYCVNKDANFGSEVINAIELIEREYLAVCDLIQNKIPEIRQRSLLNFADLDLA